MADTLNPTSVLDLAGCEYVLLTTYTQDGRAKPSPVWVAGDGDALVVTTTAQTWKVRRARREPRVTLAACDVRGRPRGGPVDGIALVVEDEYVARVTRAVQGKYGWQMRVATVVDWARRHRGGPLVGIVIRDVQTP